jgi:phosphatidylglycerophosphate synthase
LPAIAQVGRVSDVSSQHSDKTRPYARGPSTVGELFAGLAGVLAASALLTHGLEGSLRVPVAATAIYLAMAGLILSGWPERRRGLGWANRVTLMRGGLVALLAGALADPGLLGAHPWPLAGLAFTALLLDGADGWVARRTGTASAFGARFDMELDAFFILVLCLALLSLGKVGAWVLAIGAMRYLFLLAGWRLRWLSAPLPASRRRQAVCVGQVAALLICLLPPVGDQAAAWLAATALAVLTASFAVDGVWLWRYRR